jgi:hypothetical protein
MSRTPAPAKTPAVAIARILRDLGLKQGCLGDFRITGVYNRAGERMYTDVVVYSRHANYVIADNADLIERLADETGFAFRVNVHCSPSGYPWASVSNGRSVRTREPYNQTREISACETTSAGADATPAPTTPSGSSASSTSTASTAPGPTPADATCTTPAPTRSTASRAGSTSSASPPTKDPGSATSGKTTMTNQAKQLTHAQERALAAVRAADGEPLSSSRPEAKRVSLSTLKALEARGLIHLRTFTSTSRWTNRSGRISTTATTTWTATRARPDATPGEAEFRTLDSEVRLPFWINVRTPDAGTTNLYPFATRAEELTVAVKVVGLRLDGSGAGKGITDDGRAVIFLIPGVKHWIATPAPDDPGQP